MEYLSQHIESLIFAAEQPVTLKEIKTCLEETFQTKFKQTDLADTVQGLMKKYENDGFSFEIIEIAEGYQFLTKGAYHNSVGTMLKQKTKKRLSRAALETLSIIAYKQPVTKSEMEKIRGVSCDYSVQKLLEKELIAITGRSDAPGRPLLYGTSEKFMDYFGIKSIKDLPKLKDFKTADSEIGEAASADEALSEALAKNSSAATENVPLAGEAAPETPKDETLTKDETPTEVPLADQTETEVLTEDTPTDNTSEDTTDSLSEEATTILPDEETVILSDEIRTDEEE